MVNKVLVDANIALNEYKLFRYRIAMALEMEYHKRDSKNIINIGDAIEYFASLLGEQQKTIAIQPPGIIISEIQSKSHLYKDLPLMQRELLSLCGINNKKLCAYAIKKYPELDNLYRDCFSPYAEGYQHRSKAKIRERLMSIMAERRIKRLEERLYFSPLLQISIGHLSRVTDAIALTKNDNGRSEAKITVFRSISELGMSLLNWIKDNELADLEIMTANSVLEYNINEAHSLYEADYYIDLLPPTKKINEWKKEVDDKGRIIFHLRTSEYKNDAVSFHASLRNVKASSYTKLAKQIENRKGEKALLITAETGQYVEGSDKLHIKSKKEETMQWNEMSRSKYIVGTASGISHLHNLGRGAILVTNSNGLAIDGHYGDFHLIACKRFKIKEKERIQPCKSY